MYPAERRQHDLVNPLEDGSYLLPLLICHSRPARIPIEKGVYDYGPIRELRPQGIVSGGQGSYD